MAAARPRNRPTPSDVHPFPAFQGVQAMMVNQSVFARLPIALLTAGALCAALAMAPVHAQSEASVALSMLPVASVVGTASVASTAAGAVVALPAALSVGGAVLTVKAVQASATGTVYLLERASDRAQASVGVVGRGAPAPGQCRGTVLSLSGIAARLAISSAR